jgi:hypothetical protein
MTEPQLYHAKRYMTDDMVRLSNGNVLSGYMREELERMFNATAQENGFPEGARPLWCLSWEYSDDGERP